VVVALTRPNKSHKLCYAIVFLKKKKYKPVKELTGYKRVHRSVKERTKKLAAVAVACLYNKTITKSRSTTVHLKNTILT
jgi:hypothetical protein